MKNLRRILLTSTLAVAVSGLASATTITYNLVSDNGTTSTYTATETYSSGAVSTTSGTPSALAQFDYFGNLGLTGATLTGATLYYGYTAQINSLSVTNNGATAGITVSLANAFSVDSGTTLPSADLTNLLSGANSGGGATLNQTVDTRSVPGFTNQNITAGGTYSIPSPTFLPASGEYNLMRILGAISGSNTSTTPVALTSSLYTGTGFFDFGANDSVSFVGQIVGGGSPNVTVTSNTQFSATSTLVYTYTVADPPPSSTPEPATFALFGGALLGAGLLRKRAVR